MAYKALDVANYIVNYCIAKGMPISNLKLQKIMYYVQAAFLVEKNGRCAFNEPIVAWRYGPVVEGVYNKFKKHLDRPIEASSTGLDIPNIHMTKEGRIIVGRKNDNSQIEINDEDKVQINNVVDKLIKKNAFELVKTTHEEDPWRYANLNNQISVDSIKNYFTTHRGRIYGKWD
jgi:uncharacterized phage-associated protein